MKAFRAFLQRKNIVISAKRYGIDALGAMSQGLFCSLLIGTIIKTFGQQLGVHFLTDVFGDEDTAAAAMEVILEAPPEIQVLAVQLISIIREEDR